MGDRTTQVYKVRMTTDPQYSPDLKYRRQYFSGPSPFSAPHWKVYSLPDGSSLSTHPELAVTQVSRNGFQATLIGFALDPDRVDDTNEQVVKRLCDTAKTLPDFIELTDFLAGRWIFLVTLGDSSLAWNDAGGTRPIYYHIDSNGRAWLGSQPGLFEEHFGFRYSEDAQRYLQSPGYTRRLEAWWPGDSTAFAEVKHLLPNHLLDLKTGQVRRFWPRQPLKKIAYEDGIRKTCEILKGTLASARRRFPLAMSLSSGYDSRLVFSACKDFAPEVIVFSMMYRKLTEEHDDIRVPREMSRAVGFPLQVLDARRPASEAFDALYRRQFVEMKNDWSSLIETRFNEIPQDRVVLKGSISEIMRARYWSTGVYPFRVTLRDVVRLMNLGSDLLVIDRLREWMKDALPVEKLGYRLLDFLSWEIEIGNWMGSAPTVYDLAHEEFTPFSNRNFLSIMLGVDPKYRSYPYHLMERAMVRYLWPALSEFPYSPSRKVPKRRFTEGGVWNGLRWIRYSLFEKKVDRLAE